MYKGQYIIHLGITIFGSIGTVLFLLFQMNAGPDAWQRFYPAYVVSLGLMVTFVGFGGMAGILRREIQDLKTKLQKLEERMKI